MSLDAQILEAVGAEVDRPVTVHRVKRPSTIAAAYALIELLPDEPRVYVFSAGRRLSKIGFTKDLHRRMWELQNMLPIPLYVEETLSRADGNVWMLRSLERHLHRAFADCRRHSEWFELPTDWRERLAHERDENERSLWRWS